MRHPHAPCNQKYWSQTNFREGDLEDISRILNDNGVRLEAVAIQPAGGGAAAADSRGANVELLHQLLSMVCGKSYCIVFSMYTAPSITLFFLDS